MSHDRAKEPVLCMLMGLGAALALVLALCNNGEPTWAIYLGLGVSAVSGVWAALCGEFDSLWKS